MKSRQITGIATGLPIMAGCQRKEQGIALEQSPRDRLVAKIAKQTDVATLYPRASSVDDFLHSVEQEASSPKPSPVVSLEDFFEGNRDEGSFGCNVIPYPGLDRFYTVLRSVRAKQNVQEVLMAIHSIEDGRSWPFSESVWILAAAPQDQVLEWVRPLKPTEI